MKGLVWALYLMVQDPGADSASWAFTGVTYLNKQSCVSDAATFTKMPTKARRTALMSSQTSTTSASSSPNRSTTRAREFPQKRGLSLTGRYDASVAFWCPLWGHWQTRSETI